MTFPTNSPVVSVEHFQWRRVNYLSKQSVPLLNSGLQFRIYFSSWSPTEILFLEAWTHCFSSCLWNKWKILSSVLHDSPSDIWRQLSCLPVVLCSSSQHIQCLNHSSYICFPRALIIILALQFAQALPKLHYPDWTHHSRYFGPK